MSQLSRLARENAELARMLWGQLGQLSYKCFPPELFLNLTIEPFTVVLALLPLVVYLAIFSYVRVSGRGLVTTGARDIAAMAIAISGLLAVGPAELFFPQTAAILFGPMVWLALILFYALVVTLIALTSTPKLVVFGRSPEDVYEPLLRAAQTLDPAATGDAGRMQVRFPA